MRFWLITFMALISSQSLACAISDPASEPRPIKANVLASKRVQIVDQAYFEFALSPATKVRFAATPGKSAAENSFAGLITLRLTRPTVLSVELSDSSYVDLVRGGKTLTALTHGHPDHPCSTMHKFVNFSVLKGDYILQISGAPSAKVRVATKFVDG